MSLWKGIQDAHTHTGRCRVNMQAEAGVMHLQANECQGGPASPLPSKVGERPGAELPPQPHAESAPLML